MASRPQDLAPLLEAGPLVVKPYRGSRGEGVRVVRRADQLSRGMQQRLAIGRAILHEPRLLVLDEPDASLGEAAADLLTRVMEGKTVILATHDHALANRLCPRTLELRHGRSLGTATRLRVVR